MSWWRAEGNALDHGGTNNGVLLNNATYGTGSVGLGFVLDGNADAIQLDNPASLRLQDLTIETWVKRASASLASLTGDNAGLMAYGSGGYAFALFSNGDLMLTKVDVDGVAVSAGVTGTNWHHVAVTRSGSSVVFYVDGVAYPAPAYNPTFTFTTSVAIGARGDNLGYSFYGTMDEMAVYSRALTATEIQNIYNAGAAGKCTTPVGPSITSQPADQTAFVGGSASFSVTATGDTLNYQWLFNDTNTISGATSSSLSLLNLQATNAGNYSVIVSNGSGAITSSNATLTVNVLPSCIDAPSGLVSWWRAEGDALSYGGTNNGTLMNNTAYGTGRVGQGFVLDGNADAVQLGNPVSLRLQDLTIETWIKRASASVASLTGDNAGLMAYGGGGYALALFSNGDLMLTKVGVDSVTVSAGVTGTNWYHVAVTKSGSTVVFYVDGVAYPAPAYNPGFTFTTSVAIGARGDNLSYGFYGTMDEMAVYSRALTATEIQNIYMVTRKCSAPVPPTITSHPTNKTALVGGSASFSVIAGGDLPLTYQWLFNDTNSIAGATNTSLILSNVQFADAGKYSVFVSNAVDATTSSNALLTVTYPPAVVRLVGNSNAVAGSTTVVPVQLVANGNENALGLSLNYNTGLLAFSSVIQGSGATNASLFYNTSQTNSGRIGLLLGLGSGETFSSGTQEMVLVSFDVVAAPASSNRTTSLTFGDVPTPRQLVNAGAVPLSAFYSNTTLTIPAAEWEGDTAPRTNGNRAVLADDWVQVGRFVAHLDAPNNGSEYQRADCAPRSTLGNGALSVTDWVQAGRYAAGLDGLTVAGGPTAEIPDPFIGLRGTRDLRSLRVVSKTVQAATTSAVSVELVAQGDENALGFSLGFNPAVLQFVSASPGSGAAGATFNMNTDDVGIGKLGIIAGLPANVTFTPGTKEVLKVHFAVAPSSSGTSNVVFVNSPVRMEVSDPGANALATSFVPGTLTISPFPPVLRIAANGSNVIVAWPVVASNYVLQVNNALSGNWSNAVNPVVIGPDNVATTPITSGAKFYRLFKP